MEILIGAAYDLTERSSRVAAVKQEQEAAGLDVVEVGPNVLRMQLPIEMPGLGHVNAYALLDSAGAAIVDPGLPGPSTWKALKARLRAAGLRVGDVHTVVVTHSHPDHFGTAGRLAKEAGAALVTHSAFRTWWAPGHECGPDEVHDVDPAEFATSNPFRGETPWGGSYTFPLRRRLVFQLLRSRWLGRFVPPAPTRRLRHGEAVKLAGREFFAVHTPGHTLDHLCLHDPEGGLLFSGDHVLPTITPHISGLGAGTDPLKSFVASLDRVAALAPSVTTVLPAHGHPFTDLVGRTEDIKRHHDERLDKLRAVALALGPSTVEALSHELFRPARWGPMAESETYAHLEHLRLAGRAETHRDNGKLVYTIP
ncbi:MAG TPA: MBL fold metallo-hydrolase [Acidimicrobiales bacterium]|jgi:glyoxylase-like metal-dependent hydrolase (beta-lactamase superfamily II)|nr:MBL fold metallo-hydrolase [Acidimicrobiales bacterium]